MHHITSIWNLEEILENGYLKARNSLKINSFKDTANHDIISKRKDIDGKNLNDYVPLHCNYLQRRHGINYNYNVCCREGKENMIYLIFNKEITAKYETLFYAFHPVSNYRIQCKNLEDFIRKMFENYLKLPITFFGKPDFSKDIVQKFFTSEILIKTQISVDDISEIKVFNDITKIKVERILKEFDKDTIPVNIDNHYYK